MIPDRFCPSTRAHARSPVAPGAVPRWTGAAGRGGRQTAAVGDQAAAAIGGTSRRPRIGWPPRGPVGRWPRLTPGRLAPRPRCRNTSRPAFGRETPHAEGPGCAPGRRTRLIDGPALRRNPDVCSRAKTSRSGAVSFRTRRRSLRTSCRSSGSVRSATSRPTTTVDATPSHPRAVERATPRVVATVTSPVRWTRFRSRWS